MSEHRAQLPRKEKDERTVNDMWTLRGRKMTNLFGVPLEIFLHCVASVISKKNYEQNICIIISRKIFQSDWTISERWTYSERKLNALWAHTGRELGALWTVSANEATRRAQYINLIYCCNTTPLRIFTKWICTTVAI